MTMQYDVKSVHTGGIQTNQALVAGRVRLKSVVITGGVGIGAARFLSSSGGAVLLELDTGANSNVTNIILPGEGILFPNGIFYTSQNVAPVGITVIYG
jgi:hypothetical protein